MTTWSPDEPYNDLPALSEHLPIDISELSALLIDARVQLARLDEMAKTMVNPLVLVNAIAVVEAQSSSAIENIVTTNDELFQNSEPSNSSVRVETLTAMRNRSALQVAYREVGRTGITAKLATRIASELMGFEVGTRASSGTYIGSSSKRLYTPPTGEARITSMLDQWQEFLNGAKKLDPLIVMALSHYQFEAIHPFIDGNGRTGRILNVAFLVAEGLLEWPVLHMSRAIKERQNEYYERLLAVTTHRRWQDWVRFMLEIVALSAISSIRQITQISNLQKSFASQVRNEVFKHGLPESLVTTLFAQPYCRIGHVVDACRVSRPTAAKWLEELEKLEMLESVRVGREKYFINRKMLEVLL